MKNISKTLFLKFLSGLILSLIMISGNIITANAQVGNGIWDSYILLGDAPVIFFVDGNHTQHPNAIAFNETSLGNFGVGNTFTLKGGLDYTDKISSHANICSGKLIYAVYQVGGGPGSWDTINLAYTNSYGDVKLDSATDQEWGNTNDSVNILNNLPPGNYYLQVYFTSTGSTSSTSDCSQVFNMDNNGTNYIASFTIVGGLNSQLEAGIWDTYVILDTTTYFVDGAGSQYPSAPFFDGTYLGAYKVGDTFNLSGGRDYTYKLKNKANICSGTLYYAVYPLGSNPDSIKKISLPYNNPYGNINVDSFINQEWNNTTNVTNIISGLPANVYKLEVYFASAGNDSSSGSCSRTFLEFNTGAAYVGGFTVINPTGINNVSGNDTWFAYPTPFTTQLNISLASGITKADKVELFDVLGRTVLTASDVTANPMQFDMSKVNAGTYYVRVTTQHGTFVRTVVKD